MDGRLGSSLGRAAALTQRRLSGHAESRSLVWGGLVCGLGAFARTRAHLFAGAGDVRDPGASTAAATKDVHFVDNRNTRPAHLPVSVIIKYDACESVTTCKGSGGCIILRDPPHLASPGRIWEI